MSARRTSFHFPREAVTQLCKIQARARYAEAADIIRASIVAYDILLDIAADYKIIVRSADGRVWPYSLFRPFTYPGIEELRTREVSNEVTARFPKNFFFSGDAVARLESIKLRCHVHSNSDVIRTSLSCFDELTSVEAVGDDVVIRGSDKGEWLFNPYTPRRPVAVAPDLIHAAPALV